MSKTKKILLSIFILTFVVMALTASILWCCAEIITTINIMPLVVTLYIVGAIVGFVGTIVTTIY